MKYKLLLVEDQSIVRDGISALLNALPAFQVAESVGSVTEALQILAKPHVIDLILCDFNLRGETAYKLLEANRQGLFPPIVLLTSFNHSIELQRCMQMGARGFLFKECEHKELQHALLSVAEGGVYFAVLDQPLGHSTKSFSPQEATVQGLTPSEQEILKWMATGMSNKQIAISLGKSSETVKVQVSHIMKKLGAKTRTHAVVLAAQQNLL